MRPSLLQFLPVSKKVIFKFVFCEFLVSSVSKVSLRVLVGKQMVIQCVVFVFGNKSCPIILLKFRRNYGTLILKTSYCHSC